jgi:hypothetical protein
MRAIHSLAAIAFLAPATVLAVGFFENPADNATVSGVSIVSGWHCTATRVEVEFDGSIRTPAATGTDRLDTLDTCGRRDTGFGLLLNWAVLAPGPHTVRVLADGVEFGRRTVSVVGLGAQFLTGKAASAIVSEFPEPGRELVLDWQTGLQSFVAREVRDGRALSGTWNGANLERRSNCTASQNNGTRGTYAQWVIAINTTTQNLMQVQETGVTGLTCTYTGTHRMNGNKHEWVNGAFSCSDGKQGTFNSTDITFSDTALSIRLAMKLGGSESCDVDAILGGSRF